LENTSKKDLGKSGTIEFQFRDEKATRTLEIDEYLLRAFIVSHLSPWITMVKNWDKEFEEIIYDKDRKTVSFTFKKE